MLMLPRPSGAARVGASVAIGRRGRSWALAARWGYQRGGRLATTWKGSGAHIRRADQGSRGYADDSYHVLQDFHLLASHGEGFDIALGVNVSG